MLFQKFIIILTWPFCILEYILILQDYKLAVDVLNSLIENPRCEYNVEEKRAQISSLARIYLQLGNLKIARHYFEQSSALKPDGYNFLRNIFYNFVS